jgi:hypothetical protein
LLSGISFHASTNPIAIRRAKNMNPSLQLKFSVRKYPVADPNRDPMAKAAVISSLTLPLLVGA